MEASEQLIGKGYAFDLIKKFESLRCVSYFDEIGKIWTIGEGTTKYPNGLPVKEGDTCTPIEADVFLKFHLNKYVYSELTAYELPPKIYAACSSLIYNVGHIGPSLRNILELKKWDKLPEAFRKYIVADGRVSEGLKNRREKEISFMIDECHV